MLLFALTAGTFVKEEFFGSKLTIILLQVKRRYLGLYA